MELWLGEEQFAALMEESEYNRGLGTDEVCKLVWRSLFVLLTAIQSPRVRELNLYPNLPQPQPNGTMNQIKFTVSIQF